MNISTGHYKAYRRVGADKTVWVCASDDRVERVREEDVPLSDAYMLFYERIVR